MRTRILPVVLVILLPLLHAAAGDKPTCAVLPFKAIGTVAPGMAEILTERIFFEIAKSGRYQMVERTQVDRYMKENEISAIMSDAAGIEAGRLLGARFVVIGSVGQLGQLTTLNSRIVDVETGAITAQAANDHEGRVEALMRVAEASARQLLGLGVADIPVTAQPPPPSPPNPEPTPQAPTPYTAVSPNAPYTAVTPPPLTAVTTPTVSPAAPPPAPPSSAAMVEGQPFSLDLGDGVRLDLVWIVPGQFEMGAGGRSRGRPVTVSRGFWMGRCEVSNRQYQRFVAAAAYTGPRDGNARHLFHFTQQRVYTGANYPIIWVNWMNANSFCNWLTTQAQSTGQLPAQGKVRLPADAEWEYACRAGTRTSYYNGDRASDLSRIAWWEENCGRHGPKAVGLKEPNAWGLCDMLGNAAEWVQERVLRGGAWDFEAEECTSRYRRPFDPTKSEIYTGFRIVVSLN